MGLWLFVRAGWRVSMRWNYMMPVFPRILRVAARELIIRGVIEGRADSSF